MDETILPCDFKSAGQIIDDEIHQRLVLGLPAGVKLTAVMDCCHSGTGMDLPYVHNPSVAAGRRGADGFLGTFGFMAADMAADMLFRGGGQKYKKSKKKGKGGGGGNMAAIPPSGQGSCPGDVILFSGCADSQTSADTNALSKVVTTGAMTYALIQCLEKNPNQTYSQLLDNMRAVLRGKFTQVPQLSTARPFNLNTPFSL